MKIEVMARWAEQTKDPAELEDFRTRRAIGIEDGDELPIKYTYAPLVVDTHNIKSFNFLDEEHTIIRELDGDNYCIRIPFYAFVDLYSKATGENIVQVQEVKVQRGKRKKQDDSLD